MQQNKNLAIEATIRDSIDVQNLGLTLIGTEYKTTLGRIDILAKDENDNKIPIEIKVGTAGDSSIGQILGYMTAIGATQGIIMANEFSERVKAISENLGIKLCTYQIDVIVCDESVIYKTPQINDYDNYDKYNANDKWDKWDNWVFNWACANLSFTSIENDKIFLKDLFALHQLWYKRTNEHSPLSIQTFEKVFKNNFDDEYLEFKIIKIDGETGKGFTGIETNGY